jgi:hypothetical protein
MEKITQIISIKGKRVIVPAFRLFDDINIIILGKFLKICQIYDEFWVDSKKLPDPKEVINSLKNLKKKPDIFTFAQRIPDIIPHYPYYYEWENFAVATIESYSKWYEKDIDRSVRKHIKKSQREGIVTKIVNFNDEIVEGIYSIYNEKKIRQGKFFWHYGKNIYQIREENETYLDRSIFIGAYLGNELVGFIKFVIDGEVGNIMQIIGKTKYFQKRPMNALISKAIEICEYKNIKYLIYGEHTYGKKDESSLIKFKENNGFKKIEFPRYYVPLTKKGNLALKFKIHKGLKNLFPQKILKKLISIRSKYYKWFEDNYKLPIISD